MKHTYYILPVAAFVIGMNGAALAQEVISPDSVEAVDLLPGEVEDIGVSSTPALESDPFETEDINSAVDESDDSALPELGDEGLTATLPEKLGRLTAGPAHLLGSPIRPGDGRPGMATVLEINAPGLLKDHPGRGLPHMSANIPAPIPADITDALPDDLGISMEGMTDLEFPVSMQDVLPIDLPNITRGGGRPMPQLPNGVGRNMPQIGIGAADMVSIPGVGAGRGLGRR